MKKSTKITLAVVAAVLAGLAALCWTRWGAWFGNPIEPPYRPSDSICRVQLTLGRCGAQSRAVSWQCGDSAMAASLLLVPENSTDTQRIVAESRLFETTGGRTVCYWAYLDSLAVGGYCYAACVGGQTSAWRRFAVADWSHALTFVYVGDVQDTIDGTLHKDFARIQQTFSPDFWLFGGDIIERPHDRYWNEYFRAVSAFCDSVPMLAIPGNHEYLKGIDRQLEERFHCVFPYFLDKEQHAGFAALFALELPSLSLFLLDSNNDLWTLPRQRAWLADHLQAHASRWTIAALHHPVYSLRGRANNLFVRWTFAKIFNAKPFDLVLEGHEHAYARRTTNGSTPVYLVSQCSPKDYHISFDAGYERYGLGQRFFQVVAMAGDTLRLTTRTLDGALYDELLLVKTSAGVQILDEFAQRPEWLEVDASRYRKSAEKQEAYRQEVKNRLEKMHGADSHGD